MTMTHGPDNLPHNPDPTEETLLEVGGDHLIEAESAATEPGVTEAGPDLRIVQENERAPVDEQKTSIGKKIGATVAGVALLVGGFAATRGGNEGGQVEGVEAAPIGEDSNIETPEDLIEPTETTVEVDSSQNPETETTAESLSEQGYIIADSPEEAFEEYFNIRETAINQNKPEFIENITTDEQAIDAHLSELNQAENVRFASAKTEFETDLTIESVEQNDDITYTVSGEFTDKVINKGEHLPEQDVTVSSTIIFEKQEVDGVSVWVGVDIITTRTQ